MTGAPPASSEVRRTALGPTVLLLLLVSAGCSTFNHDWAAARAAPAPAPGLEGLWDGTWRSDVNAHTGRLRCLITKDSNETYQARFQAKYRKIIPLTFSYTVPLTVTATNGGVRFAGAANLGWYAGGRYTYAGHATATNFISRYDSRYDRGAFEMTRAR